MGTSVAASGRSLHIARPEDNDGLVDEENGFVEATRLTEACAYADIHKALGAHKREAESCAKGNEVKKKTSTGKKLRGSVLVWILPGGMLKDRP